MKGAKRTRYGGPSRLRIADLPIPRPSANELLIRVYAATVNRTDCAVLSGKPYVMRLFTGLLKPAKLSTGTDFAGEVVQKGEKVSDFVAGDRVWGFVDNGIGSHAEYTTVRADARISKIPEGVSYETAAASAEAAHYAYYILRFLKIKSGTQVLVNGGSGGIGSALIQFLVFEGAEVTAVCRSQHFDRLKKLGVKNCIDYEHTDFTKSSDSYDYVLDSVGKSTFFKCRHILKSGGAYISSELGPFWQNLYLPLITRFFGSGRVHFPIPGPVKMSHEYIGGLLSKGFFTPLIDRKCKLAEIQVAFTYVCSGQKLGNVLLLPNAAG